MLFEICDSLSGIPRKHASVYTVMRAPLQFTGPSSRKVRTLLRAYLDTERNEAYNLLMRSLRHRTIQTFSALGLLSLTLLVQGCISQPPPAGVRYPITSGVHTVLPTAERRILLWADPPLADVALDWFRSHRYADVLLPEQGPFQRMQVSHRFSDRAAALAVAKEMGADLVLFLEHEESKEGALIEPHCGPLFNVNVDVRGLWVQSGDTALRGNAHYPHCVALTDETLRHLTCQAFATAWGYRPSGQLEIPSHLMCTVGQTERPIR